MICKGDFEAYLLALSRDHCISDPFLGLFYQNSGANRGLLKSPLFAIFRFWVSPLFGLSSVVVVRSIKNFRAVTFNLGCENYIELYPTSHGLGPDRHNRNFRFKIRGSKMSIFRIELAI